MENKDNFKLTLTKERYLGLAIAFFGFGIYSALSVAIKTPLVGSGIISKFMPLALFTLSGWCSVRFYVK